MRTMTRWADTDGDDLETKPFDPFDLIIVGIDTVGRTLTVLANSLAFLSAELRSHSNYRRERSEFAGSVEAGIETLGES